MPTYEYLCQTCSHRFETWQKMTDDPLTICPECGGHIRRVLFAAGVVFKGSGFYKTDHGSGSLASTSSNGDASTTTSTETKSAEGAKTAESKPTDGSSKSSSNGASSSTESKASIGAS